MEDEREALHEQEASARALGSAIIAAWAIAGALGIIIWAVWGRG